jgi:RNA polymerase sigma factor (sigma-70 family)
MWWRVADNQGMTPIVSTAILRTQSDARLAALARERHERAFEAIVERYRKPLLRHCRRFLPETRAEDAVQQTFLNAWSALGNGAHIEDLRAWLYRISRNAALDAAKRAGYDYSELSDGLQLTPAPDDEIERRWVVRETLGGMAALPAGQCEALLRTAVEGHSRADIARDMQISEGAVRQLVHRARAALRAAATAVTPMPFATWASGIGSGGGQMGTRVTEMVAEAGAAGGAGVLLKAGSAVVAVGAFAVGTGAELERSPAKSEASAEPPRAQATVPAPDEARLAREVAGDRSDRNGARVAETAGEDEPLTARRVDNSGPGSVNSGPGSVESGASSSGPGSGENDLEDNSGPGSTSGSSGGSSGPGSGGDDGGDNSGSGGGGSGSASGGRSGSGSGDGG